MTVYLLHLDEPLPCGLRNGKTTYSGHYLGYAEDLVGRILEHQETTWEPFDEPVILENGKKCLGVKHGPGATFMGVANYKGITWRLARTWDGADREFERRLKNCKMGPDLCPICNPRAMNRMNLENVQ